MSIDALPDKSFIKYFQLLTSVLQKKVKKTLPLKCSLIFDEWSSGSTHYLGIFASFPPNNILGYDQNILDFGPCDDKYKLDANCIYNYIEFTFSVKEKTGENVTALIGDCALVNKSFFANGTGKLFVECCSHLYNLAVSIIFSFIEMRNLQWMIWWKTLKLLYHLPDWDSILHFYQLQKTLLAGPPSTVCFRNYLKSRSTFMKPLKMILQPMVCFPIICTEQKSKNYFQIPENWIQLQNPNNLQNA